MFSGTDFRIDFLEVILLLIARGIVLRAFHNLQKTYYQIAGLRCVHFLKTAKKNR